MFHNGLKVYKMVQNCPIVLEKNSNNRPKLFNMVKNGPNRSKWFKMLQNFLISQKLSKMVQHGPKLSNMNVFLCFPYGSGTTRSPGIFPTLASFPVLLKANAARNCHLS